MKWVSLITTAALIAAIGFQTDDVYAYEQPTHVVLSQQAFNSSIMHDVTFQYGLGAFGINNDYSIAYQQYRDSVGSFWDLYALVQSGAWNEDLGNKPLNHFFNPINNTKLDLPRGFSSNYTSPDWALEDSGQISGQDFSFADARGYYYKALTATKTSDKNDNFSKTYESLGHVLHHIQDMAQPQHARVEAHCNAFWGCLIPGAAFGYYHPSSYETYVLSCTFNSTFDPGCPSLISSLPPVFEQSTATSTTPFTLPRKFWTQAGASGNGGTLGSGIAEFSNAGFIGARTNFKGTPTALLPSSSTLPLPNGNGAVPHSVLLSDSTLLGSSYHGSAAMTFISSPVNDALLNTSATNAKTSAYSLLDSDLQVRHFSPVFSVNRFTHAAAASFLIPRAISYSAGLLNYFFRGQIGIGLPHEGVYGVLDHAQQYNSGSTTQIVSPTQGFHTIKVALTNTTADGEAMQNGTLKAVLRFRRNSTFVDTLTSEPGSPSGGGLTAVRGNDDEYIVSSGVVDNSNNAVADHQVNLDSTPQEFAFQFDTPLPLNSTDVYLQIVFQGDLGQEKQTAVVASTLDISEPSYLTVFNSFDYISIGGQLLTRDQLNANPDLLAQVQPQSCVDYSAQPPVLKPSCFRSDQTLQVYLDKKNTGPSDTSLIWLDQLPVQSYVRVAVLIDGFNASAQSSFINGSTCNIGDPSMTVPALNNEIAISADNSTVPVSYDEIGYSGTLGSLRGIVGWSNYFCVWDGDGSAKVTGDGKVLTPLPDQNKYPVQVNLNFPQPSP